MFFFILHPSALIVTLTTLMRAKHNDVPNTGLRTADVRV
jgi:hypothetical protein